MSDRPSPRRFKALPKDSALPGEKGRWDEFKSFLTGWLKKGDNLADRATEAEIARREAEAREANAKADNAQLAVAEKFLDLIDRVQESDVSEDFKQLQKAALLQANPEVMDVLIRLEEKRRLLEEKGFRARVIEAGDEEEGD